MTRNTLPPPRDRAPSWSSWFAVAAFVASVLALLGPPPFNGMSLVASMLWILSVVHSAIEYHRRPTRHNQEGNTP